MISVMLGTVGAVRVFGGESRVSLLWIGLIDGRIGLIDPAAIPKLKIMVWTKGPTGAINYPF